MRPPATRPEGPRRTAPVAAACLLLCLCSFQVGVSAQSAPASVRLPADVASDVRVIHYPVTGSTAEELREAMLEAGPTDDGEAWYGYTTWHVRWRYDYAPTDGGCRIEDVDVSFRSRIRLPRWQPAAEADPELVSRWEDFVAGLREHEFGHRDIGAEAARTIRQRLTSFRWRACDDMTERANGLGHEILDRFRGKERRYDRRTRHGSTQGAVWPPEAPAAAH